MDDDFYQDENEFIENRENWTSSHHNSCQRKITASKHHLYIWTRKSRDNS